MINFIRVFSTYFNYQLVLMLKYASLISKWYVFKYIFQNKHKFEKKKYRVGLGHVGTKLRNFANNLFNFSQ